MKDSIRKIRVLFSIKKSNLFILCVFLIPQSLSAADGKAIYDANCKFCHETGIGGAPGLDDKKDWQNRVEKGIDGLLENAIKGMQGYGGDMPPRGGNPKLTDAEVKAAVEYMMERVK